MRIARGSCRKCGYSIEGSPARNRTTIRQACPRCGPGVVIVGRLDVAARLDDTPATSSPARTGRGQFRRIHHERTRPDPGAERDRDEPARGATPPTEVDDHHRRPDNTDPGRPDGTDGADGPADDAPGGERASRPRWFRRWDHERGDIEHDWRVIPGVY